MVLIYIFDGLPEISACLVKYLALVKEQKFAEIAAELARLPACTHWLTPQFKVQYAPKAEDDSSSDDSDCDDDDSESDEAMDDDQPAKPTRKPKASSSAGMDFEDEDGWTTVRRKN